MDERLCEQCRHFSAAQTCIEKPTWGYCMWPISHNRRKEGIRPQPLFTWADGTCNRFEAKLPAALDS